jgi:hypothetical protein
MKTSEKQSKFQNFMQQRQANMDRGNPDFPADLNEERIKSVYRPKERVYYYDNSQISLSYGQYNIEKCLIVLSVLILTSGLLIYNYFFSFSNISFVIFISTSSVDIIVAFIYLYFLIKLKSDENFNRIPIGAVNGSDVIIMLNFVMKLVLFIMVSSEYGTLGILAIILMSIKFLMDFYFTIISVKLLMFCPCTIWIQEATEKIWTTLKYYIFCCDQEAAEPENTDYTKIEDIESFY